MDAVQRYGAKSVSLPRERYAGKKKDLIRWAEQWDQQEKWPDRKSSAESNQRCAKRGGAVMSIIGWILFGLIVGVVAKLIMPGPDPGGMIVTILLGIVGALIGGFIGRMLGWYGEGDPVGFIMAVIGAIVVLFGYRKISSTSQVRV
jgi:uncharacterized membrane protein YeaQ/YmgE (transglycosylase-associated protein family)